MHRAHLKHRIGAAQAYRGLRQRFPDQLLCGEGTFIRAVARVQVRPRGTRHRGPRGD